MAPRSGASTTPAPLAEVPARRDRWMRALAAWNVAMFAAWVAAPFAVAGRVSWVAGWAHLGAVVAGLLAHGAWVARRNPELRRHRRSVGPGTKRWDLVWNLLHWPLMASIALAAGLEARRGPSPLPPALFGAGLLLLGAGMAVNAWAMAVNPFFEGTVRVQAERGHRVVDAGPYRLVRHPGYLGLVLWALGSPFLLLSVWALAPAVLAAAWVVLRTALEDATLRRELDGYSDYARRVRFRLVPGLW
jgi:protein-S-isoprenylcysteine O-methyltransferase Ste14